MTGHGDPDHQYKPTTPRDLSKGPVTFAEYAALNPCWCGQPSVEVVSNGDGHGGLVTQGYCSEHCEKREIVRHRKRHS